MRGAFRESLATLLRAVGAFRAGDSPPRPIHRHLGIETLESRQLLTAGEIPLAVTAVLDATTFQGSHTVSREGANGYVAGDDFIRVDANRSYELSGWARSGDEQGAQYNPSNRQYFGFASYDIDQLPIYVRHVAKVDAAGDTRLAQALRPGDLEIVLEDASGWYDGTLAHMRGLAWYGYRDSTGFTYPDYSYTRNVLYDAWDAAAIDGNRIRLRMPWTGPALSQGAAVRNATEGPTFNYLGVVYQSVDTDWSHYAGTIQGTMQDGNASDPTEFRLGTAYVRPIILINYGGPADNRISWRDVAWSYPAAEPFHSGDLIDLHVAEPSAAEELTDYHWVQTGGVDVPLHNSSSRTAQFVVPEFMPTDGYENFVFRVEASQSDTNGAGTLTVPFTLDLAITAALDATTFGGSFTVAREAVNGFIAGDDFIRVDVQRSYELSGWARSGDGLGGQYDPANRQYFGFASYDIDKLPIHLLHVAKVAGSQDTRLAEDLRPGDLEIVLEDASGWYSGSLAHMRGLAWYGYRNSTGYTYPDYSYTRNVFYNAWDTGAVAGNRIQLRTPWAGPTLSRGAAIRNAAEGSTYNYPGMAYQPVSATWSRRVATIQGTMQHGIATDPAQFRTGTAYVKPIILFNYGGPAGNRITWRDVTWSYPAAEPLHEGDVVDLRVSEAAWAEGPLEYSWAQIAGPPAPLQNAASHTAQLVVPASSTSGQELVVQIDGRAGSATVQRTHSLLIDPLAADEKLALAIDEIARHVARSTRTFDTTAPLTPSRPSLVPDNDTGASHEDQVTQKTTLTITGSAEAGSSVALYADGSLLGRTTAKHGVYTLTAAGFTDGAHQIVAVATDAHANSSLPSEPLVVIVDTVAPAAPSTPTLTANLSFVGTAEPGATVELYLDERLVGSATAADSVYSVSLAVLEADRQQVTARAVDAAGNRSASSGSLELLKVRESDDSGQPFADYTPVIQTVFDAVPEQGATVYIPPGVYGLSNSLVVPANTRVLGAGQGLTILQALSPTYLGLTVHGATVNASLALIAVHDSTVESLTLDHRTHDNVAPGILLAAAGLDHSGTVTTNVRVSDVEILAGESTSILLATIRADGTRISNNRLEGPAPFSDASSSQRGIAVHGGAEIIIQDNQLQRIRGAAIDLETTTGFPLREVLVTGNRVDLAADGVVLRAVSEDGGEGIDFSQIELQSNTLANVWRYGMHVSLSGPAMTWEAIEISGNTVKRAGTAILVEHVNSDASQPPSAGDTTPTRSDIAIRDNRVEASLGAAAMALVGIQHMEVAGNTVLDSWGHGLSTTDSSHLFVTDNALEGSGQSAVTLSGGGRLYLRNNLFGDYARALPSPGMGIRDALDVIVTANEFDVAGERNVRAVEVEASSTNVLVLDNQLRQSYQTDPFSNEAASEPGFWIDVRVFGTRRDGVADDTDAIQAALDAVPLTAGATVFLSEGLYSINNCLIVHSETRLLGEQAETTVLRGKAGSYPGKVIGGVGIGATVAIVGASNSSVERITVDHHTNGTWANGIIVTPDGYFGDGVTPWNNTIQNNRVLGFDRHEYLIWNFGANGTRILNNYVDGGVSSFNPNSNQEGIEVYGGRDILIEGNTVERVGNYGITVGTMGIYIIDAPSGTIVVAPFEAVGVTIRRNTVRNSGNGVFLGAYNRAEDDRVEFSQIVVEDNTLLDTYESGIEVKVSFPNISVSDFTIRGNRIFHAPTGISVYMAEAYAADNSFARFEITENFVMNTTGYAAVALHFVRDVRLTGNTIIGSAGEGLRITGCSDILVSGNTMYGLGYNAVNSHRSSRVNVRDNFFADYARCYRTPGVIFSMADGGSVVANYFDVQPANEHYAVIAFWESFDVAIADNVLLYSPTLPVPILNLSGQR